ncbi:hypothetical protein LSTR_LSTR014813 [Laodelphax striatellus]|uniref:C2H2-type domain-containing protein n=1 Tax=Laodelphax striatellus TaxID=195883 RepID=A0A482XCZ7_LAOST|nr:hypothetical protein LSTR_LSTR014813 [Laodelphax striatellus]
MCGDKKCKVDVFSHFLFHHQISLLPLAQKFMSQNLNIRVIGIDSETDCQSSQNVSFCKGCSGKVSEEVPLSAHKFICLGDVMCKICLQSQGNQLTRDVHITEEHKNYPCALGCSNRTVFDTEDKLHEHCLTVHDVKPCFLCGSYVRCAEGLMKQHLQVDHSYYRSDEILSSDSIFNVHCGNLTIGLICSLCDFDALIQISSIDDLFKHLNYHSVSLRAAFHFLEKDNLHQSLCMKLNQIRFTQKASIQTKGSEQNVDEFYQLPYSDIEYLCASNTNNPQQNYCQFDQPMKIFLGEESISMLETNGKIEPSSIQESNVFDVNNVVNGTENNCILHKDILIMENIFPGPSSSEEKENSLGLIEDSGTPRVESIPRLSIANKTRELKDEDNPSECQQKGTTDETESRTRDIDDQIRKEGISQSVNDDFIEDHEGRWNKEEDVNCDGNENSQSASNSKETVDKSSVLGKEIGEYSGNPQNNIEEKDKDRGLKNKNRSKTLRFDVLNTKSIVNPNGVECVVTDISDIEDSDCEMEVDSSNSNMQSAGSSSSAGVRSRKRKKSRDSKSLPGLNRIDVGRNGFACGVCCGKFNRHEGMRELLKHMRRLHGFSCNFNGSKQAEAFKYKRGKAGSSMSMQPGKLKTTNHSNIKQLYQTVDSLDIIFPSSDPMLNVKHARFLSN